MRICLVKFGPFDFESVGDGAKEPARVLNFHSLVTKERGDPGWVSRGGEGTRPVLMATGLKPGPFLGQKILKYKPSFGKHSPCLVLKLFISNRANSHYSHCFCILACSADNYKFYQASQTNHAGNTLIIIRTHHRKK